MSVFEFFEQEQLINNRINRKKKYKYTVSKNQQDAWNLIFRHKPDWELCDDYSLSDFVYSSYCDVYGKNMYFRKEYTKFFHRKYIFFSILMDNNISYCPKTWFSYKKFLRNEPLNGDLWFLKLSTFDCGGGVTPFFATENGISRPRKYLKEDRYIIQKGVQNLLLYDNRKFDSRVHILINRKGNVYLYKEAVIRISHKKFSEKCCCRKHQLTNGSLGVEAISSNDFPLWRELYGNLILAIKEIMRTMMRFRDKKGFALIGFDFIFDKNRKPWILEANTYPNLYYQHVDPHLQPMINDMMDTTLDIIVYKKNKNTNFRINNLWQRVV